MRCRFIILCTFILLLSGCYDRHRTPPTVSSTVEANCSIDELRRLCAEGMYNIDTEKVCVGRVTSSDREGNFYRTLLIEDESGALELKLGTYNSASQFPIGLQIFVRLNGTALMVEDGVIQVGLQPLGHDNRPREFESQATIDRHIIRSTSVEDIAPLELTIPALDTSFCGRFVRIEGLHRVPSEADDNNKGYYCFCDDSGMEIFLNISPYANFTLPDTSSSRVTLQGVLYHSTIGIDEKGCYIIKVRFSDDISITNLP